MKQKEFCCTSVAGGWQTGFVHTELTFGPVFNNIQDLWAWQKANLYEAE